MTEIKNKKDLTKKVMLEIMKDKNADDKKWFKALMHSSKKKTKNNLNGGKEIDTFDYSKIREEFCKKFYPTISSEYKKNKAKESAKKKTDEMLDFLNSIED